MNNMVIDRREVADLIAEHFAGISSIANYSPEFRVYTQDEKHKH